MPIYNRQFFCNQLPNTNFTTLFTVPISSVFIVQEIHANNKSATNAFLSMYVSGANWPITFVREGASMASGTPLVWQGNLAMPSGQAFVAKTSVSGMDIVACGLEVI